MAFKLTEDNWVDIKCLTLGYIGVILLTYLMWIGVL